MSQQDTAELHKVLDREIRSPETICEAATPSGVEIYAGNELYGFDRILKEYSGWDEDRSLRAVIPHGVTFHDAVSPGELHARLPAVLSFPDYRDEVYSRDSHMAVIPSASPFLYALELLPSGPKMRSGTVFFPSHSIPGLAAHQSWTELAEMCVNLPDTFQPVSVCMYWLDYLEGRHLPFVECGIPILSAGHRYSPQFTSRLIHILRSHEYCASNSNGSHLFYAMAAGCRTFLVGLPPQKIGPGSVVEAIPLSETQARVTASMKDSISGLHVDFDIQRGLAAKYLRSDQLKQPSVLRRELELSASLDRWGSLIVRGGGWSRQPVPPFLTRCAHNMNHRVRDLSVRLVGRVRRSLVGDTDRGRQEQ